MADVARIQYEIYYGYGQAAKRLGLDSEFFRSSTYLNPIQPLNSIGTIKVSVTEAWNYMKTESYGKPTWIVIADARSIPDSIGFETFDYFVIGTSTFFINAKKSLQPIQAVECNHRVKIYSWQQSDTAGFDPLNPYSGAKKIDEVNGLLAEELPVSLLEQAIGRNSQQKLPTDTLVPRWIMLAPTLGTVQFKNRDMVKDENGVNYVISAAEQTELGWRIGMELQAT